MIIGAFKMLLYEYMRMNVTREWFDCSIFQKKRWSL